MNTKRKTLKMPVRYLMNAVLVALLFVGLSFLTQNVLSTYQNKVLLTVGINIILAVSLNVATGYLGQLPLGHAGFMASSVSFLDAEDENKPVVPPQFTACAAS